MFVACRYCPSLSRPRNSPTHPKLSNPDHDTPLGHRPQPQPQPSAGRRAPHASLQVTSAKSLSKFLLRYSKEDVHPVEDEALTSLTTAFLSLSRYLCLCLSPSLHLSPSAFLHIRQAISLSLSLSVWSVSGICSLPVRPSALSACLSIDLSSYRSFYQSTCLPIYLQVYISIHVYPSISIMQASVT